MVIVLTGCIVVCWNILVRFEFVLIIVEDLWLWMRNELADYMEANRTLFQPLVYGNSFNTLNFVRKLFYTCKSHQKYSGSKRLGRC